MTLGQLIDKINNPTIQNMDPHEVTRELTVLTQTGNQSGLIELREALRRVSDSPEIADDNLYFAAVVADRVLSSNGEEASGQLSIPPTRPLQDGQVASFYVKVTGYNPN